MYLRLDIVKKKLIVARGAFFCYNTKEQDRRACGPPVGEGGKTMSEDERLDIVEGIDEDGNRLLLRVNRYFYYNGEEYVLLSDDVEEANDNLEDVTFFVMKVTVSTDEDGDEIEEFEPVEQELMDALIEVVKTNFEDDSDIKDELSDE